MKELQELIKEAERFKSRRSSLVGALKAVDEKFRAERCSLDARQTSAAKNLEAERQSGVAAIESAAKKDIASYVEMKNSLQQFAAPVKRWCPDTALAYYKPNPERVNEAELRQLIKMLQEQGLIAWIKRTFKLDGYSSRSEMALDLFQKIEDSCAYCNNKIEQIEARCAEQKSNKITETRRKLAAAQEQYKYSIGELDQRYKAEKEQALNAINRFDNSAELNEMRAKLARMQAEAANTCGAWGEYSTPSSMPEKVQLCDARLALPNINGSDEQVEAPVWINLFESNIIVVTSNSVAASNTDSREVLFVRKLLARMLKTVPPENCSYSVFDPLHKGTSLERLIDITNIGTTDLSFDLFTTDVSAPDTVSCTERRKYLRNHPAEIIKYTAGRSRSLFEYNKETGNYDFPFTWYIDFSFPDEPDNKLTEDIKEMFVNSLAAGYSFVFVTTRKGYAMLADMAKRYTEASLIHIDADTCECEKDGLRVRFADSAAPSSDQIYNFMTALKKYYEDGSRIDNRIDSVFGSKGIDLRDATKKLSIPMALDSRGRLIDLQLGGEGSVHGFISGGTNSGKSTLLHTVILSACLHYHPKDLEIWLVDYKQTEFYLYKKKTPPHIKLIGVSKTADFTFSLLDKIESEGNRRTMLMNRFEAQNLEDYRKHAGEPGYENLTRLFIVIDEFHEMSQFVASVPEYKDKLENILREYRAQGITCLLADQTFSSGLSGLTPAAKNQIGLRIAMRNEASPQELKDTLEVDRALYSDSMQHTISIMSQGEFIMKVYVRDSAGKLKDIKLEKFKGLFTKGEDIMPICKALRALYKGQFTDELLYVNTKEQVCWDDSEPLALDKAEPIRYPNIRLYLGRAATLRPCFGLDLGRQPNENLSIVGGTAYQRWEIIASIIRSCRFKGYKLLVFMAEYSDLANDFGFDIKRMCAETPNAELFETTEQWCAKLSELEKTVDSKSGNQDIVCLFIGIEIAALEMGRLPERNSGGASFSGQLAMAARYGSIVENSFTAQPSAEDTGEFNALPIIGKLFSSGARYGIRCITEVSVFRQFNNILKLRDMCRHRVAFSMSADDCMLYLGSSSAQKSIGADAVYGDGSKEIKKLLPYIIENNTGGQYL